MKTINLISCCVCRDAFRINETNDSLKKYKINKFIQSISPSTFIQEYPGYDLLSIDDFSKLESSNFVKRNLSFNFNRNLKKYLKENPSDFLIIDLCEMRFEIAEAIVNDTEKVILTKTKYINQIIDDISLVPKIKNLKIEKTYRLTFEESKPILEKYSAFLKSIYKENQIILIRNVPTHIHIDDKNNYFSYFNNLSINKTKSYLNDCYDYLQKLMPNMFVINPPKKLIGDRNHLWGLDSLHFTNEYYNYLYASIDEIITNKSTYMQTSLNEIYTKYFVLLEKERYLEYYLNQHKNENQLLKNPNLSIDNNNLLNWEFSHSKYSNYDIIKHILFCDAENNENCYAILHQYVNLFKYKNQTLTFSVKFKTKNNSKLIISVRRKTDEETKIIAINSFIGDGFEDIITLTFIVPNDLCENEITDVMIYENLPNSSSIIYKAFLEIGNTTSLT